MSEIEYIEQHNVGFGSCLVIGHYSNSMLMVDCGSMNNKVNNTPFKSIVYNISERYQDVSQRDFLLTHYHRDHICGFFHIISQNPHYFNNIFLPDVIPYRNKLAPLQELALYAKLFLPSQCGQSVVSTSALKIINVLASTVGLENVFTLRAGNVFACGQCRYKVLAPYENHFQAYDEISKVIYQLSSEFSSNYISWRFQHLKNLFCKLYLLCSNNLNIQYKNINLSQIQDLAACLNEMEKLKINFSTAQKQRVTEILTSNNFSREYSFALNSTGIVFHKTSYPTLLITGDAMPHMFETFNTLCEKYYMVQAPHHGTCSGFSDILYNIPKSHILISNGQYHAGGAICEKYSLDNAICHCTNNLVCPYFKKHKSCCNQLCICDDKSTFTFKCSAAAKNDTISLCNIYSLFGDISYGCSCS